MEEIDKCLTVINYAIEMRERYGSLYCMNITDMQIIYNSLNKIKNENKII